MGFRLRKVHQPNRPASNLRPAWVLGACCLVALALFSTGCTDPLAKYYPLAVGNEWRFQTTYPQSGEVREDVELIVRRWEDNFHLADGQQRIYLRNNGILNNRGIYLLRTPLEKGYRWVDQGVAIEITSLDRSVSVPAGDFSDCVEVTWHREKDGRSFRSIIAYAPDVGPVLYEYVETTEPGEHKVLLRSELVKFVPGGSKGSPETS